MDYSTKKSGRHFKFSRLVKRIGDLLYLSEFASMGDGYREIENDWRVLAKEKKVDVVLFDMPMIDARKGRLGYCSVVADTVRPILSYVLEHERNIHMVRRYKALFMQRKMGLYSDHLVTV